jgi:hypothetical protein
MILRFVVFAVVRVRTRTITTSPGVTYTFVRVKRSSLRGDSTKSCHPVREHSRTHQGLFSSAAPDRRIPCDRHRKARRGS